MDSKLQERLTASGARLGEYAGAQTALSFGDSDAEFAALRNHAAVYDLSWRGFIEVRGEDRVRWMNGMVTNNVRDLELGHGVYSFLLNPQGRILGDMNIFQRGDHLFIGTDAGQVEKLLAIFDKYIIMDDVEAKDASANYTALGVSGPQVQAVCKAAGFVLPRLEALQFVDVLWNGIPVTITRGLGGESYHLRSAPENAAQMWDALVAAGATPVGADALEMQRVASGRPRYGADISERDLPQETEQPHALHFKKGCYVGQEIVERIHARALLHRGFTGFVIEGPAPASGTEIQMEGRKAGVITSVASVPNGNGRKTLALGYIRREVGTPGKVIDIGEAKATVTSLPFAL